MPRKIDPSQVVVGGGVQDPSNRGLAAHIADDAASHPATNISIQNETNFYTTNNVQGALDDLAALRPLEPFRVGSSFGIPDWGILKKNDVSLVDRGVVTSTIPASEIYPYYYEAPNAEPDVLDNVSGRDPVSDPTFNVSDGVYSGGGDGQTFTGAFVRSSSLTMSHRIRGPHGGSDTPCVVSGVVHPADRGVLALLYFPPSTGLSAISTTSELEERVVAAILLGNGINSGVDGTPGGIFVEGTPPSEGIPSWPSRVGGQPNLHEQIVADITAGQVRLGTDSAAGSAFILVNGLPVLGGSSLSRAGGDNNNFFAYRLPVLNNYEDLQYTDVGETLRYFNSPPSPATIPAATTLATAGNYGDITSSGTGFSQDFWAYQLGRYRHRFTMPAPTVGVSQDTGNYLLVHFKTELAFERAVRDGIAPAATDLYSPAPANWSDLSDPENTNASATALASSYHVVRSNIFLDERSTSDPIALDLSGSGFDLIPDLIAYSTHFISGVRYATPRSSVVPSTDPNTYNYQLDLSLQTLGNAISSNVGFYVDSFRTFSGAATGLSPFTATEQRLGNANPLFVLTNCFSTEPWTMGGSAFAANSTGFSGSGRIEFSYTDVSRHLADLDNPSASDGATWSSALYGNPVIEGDTENPVLLSDAKLRVAFRRLNPQGTVEVLEIPFSSSDKILYSSTLYCSDTTTCKFGNFLDPSDEPLQSLFFSAKDHTERFLDETYRYPDKFDASTITPNLFSADEVTNLTGPGLPVVTGAIDICVRPIAAAASATISIDNNAGLIDGDFIALINPVFSPSTYTITARTGVPAADEFQIGIDAATTALNIETAINASVTSPYTATSSLNEVTLTAKTRGVVGNNTRVSLSVSAPNTLSSATYFTGGSGNAASHSIGWYAQRLNSLLNLLDLEINSNAQVSGWSDSENTDVSFGVKTPIPSTGTLIYPQEDYTTGYRPSLAVEGVTGQPDYSVCTGGRSYVRAFDVSKGMTKDVVGKSTAKIKVFGLMSSDIQNPDKVQVFVKVPGLSAWLDVAVDYFVGNKQDSSLDGAGCRVADFVDSIDPETGYHTVEVSIDTGPEAPFFLNSERKVPLLLKVFFPDTSAARQLRASPEGDPADVRVIYKITIED